MIPSLSHRVAVTRPTMPPPLKQVRFGANQSDETQAAKQAEIARHDTFFLEMLSKLETNLDNMNINYSEENDESHKSMRFHISPKDGVDIGIDYMQLGIAKSADTLPGKLGRPVLDFFAFYPYKSKPETKYTTEHLYNSALYTFRPSAKRKPSQSLKPYNYNRVQQGIQGFINLFKSSYSDLSWFTPYNEQNKAIESKLAAVVFKLAEKSGKADRMPELLNIKPKSSELG